VRITRRFISRLDAYRKTNTSILYRYLIIVIIIEYRLPLPILYCHNVPTWISVIIKQWHNIIIGARVKKKITKRNRSSFTIHGQTSATPSEIGVVCDAAAVRALYPCAPHFSHLGVSVSIGPCGWPANGA